MSARFVIVLALAALAVPASASARAHSHKARPAAISAQAQAFTIAQAYWGKTPCGGHYTVVVETLDRPAAASYVTSPDGSFTNCVMHLGRRYFGPGAHLWFPLLCKTVVHEWGHLTGFYEAGGPDNGRHSADPRNVMFDRWSDLNMPAACLRGGS